MRLWKLTLVGFCLVLGCAYGTAQAVVFPNTAPITIGSVTTPQAASPYPSNITVSGLTGVISDVNVQLNNLSHTFPDDIDVLLVGPAGQKMILMADAGDGTDVVNSNLNFDDQAANQIPQVGGLPSGTWRPGNFPDDPDGCGQGDTFSAPAPAPPYGATLTVFNGTNPNCAWSLYVMDDCGTDSGQILGGWSVDILTNTTAARILAFSATETSVGTVLRWRAGTETAVAGFNIYREAAGPRTRLNRQLIRSRGSTRGAVYRFLVDNATGPAMYRLEVLDLDGSKHWSGTAYMSGRR